MHFGQTEELADREPDRYLERVDGQARQEER